MAETDLGNVGPPIAAPDVTERAIGQDPKKGAKPASARTVLGEPEFARIPTHSWIWAKPDMALIIMFVVFTFAPLIAYMFGWESGQAVGENRVLKNAPSFSWENLPALPAEIDEHYKDYFGFRARLIHLNNIVLRKWLRISNDDEVIGKDGWLFYAREDLISNYLGLVPLSRDDLARWEEYFEARAAFLRQRNIKYMLVIAPDKASIYPEMLPDAIGKGSGLTRQDQFLSYLRETGSAMEVVDLRPALTNAKKDGIVYFPQDSHWNGRGYFVAYQEILSRIHRWYPDIHPQQLGVDYGFKQVSWFGGDWGMFGLIEENYKYPSLFLYPLGTQRAQQEYVNWPASLPTIKEPWSSVKAFRRPGTKRTLLLLHDSFMISFAVDREHQPLAEHFGRMVHVAMLPNLAQLNTLVEEYQPDIVVEERAERFLKYVPGAEPMDIGARRQISPATVSARYHAPVAESVFPSVGSAHRQTFKLTFSDGDGNADIDSVWFVINATIQQDHSCFVSYNSTSNTLALASDTAVTLGPAVIGTARNIENSQCSLDVGRASVSRSGNLLTLSLPLQFKPEFSGTKEISAWAVDRHSLESGWWTLGVWRLQF